MNNIEKYRRQYFMPPVCTYDWARKEYVSPYLVFCWLAWRKLGFDRTYGTRRKLEFFQLLVDVGFKEIEVGFPAASETEYDFLRALIERDMIQHLYVY